MFEMSWENWITIFGLAILCLAGVGTNFVIRKKLALGYLLIAVCVPAGMALSILHDKGPKKGPRYISKQVKEFLDNGK